jgi:hypothetical protein
MRAGWVSEGRHAERICARLRGGDHERRRPRSQLQGGGGGGRGVNAWITGARAIWGRRHEARTKRTKETGAARTQRGDGFARGARRGYTGPASSSARCDSGIAARLGRDQPGESEGRSHSNDVPALAHVADTGIHDDPAQEALLVSPDMCAGVRRIALTPSPPTLMVNGSSVRQISPLFFLIPNGEKRNTASGNSVGVLRHFLPPNADQSGPFQARDRRQVGLRSGSPDILQGISSFLTTRSTHRAATLAG